MQVAQGLQRLHQQTRLRTTVLPPACLHDRLIIECQLVILQSLAQHAVAIGAAIELEEQQHVQLKLN